MTVDALVTIQRTGNCDQQHRRKWTITLRNRERTSQFQVRSLVPVLYFFFTIRVWRYGSAAGQVPPR